MEIKVPALKRTILEKAIYHVNRKFDFQLEVTDFIAEPKNGYGVVSGKEVTPETALSLGVLINEKIQFITNHRWGKV